MIDIIEMTHEFKSGFRLHIRNLQLPSSGIVGLVGENGAGKTTLMSILAGYLKANKAHNVSFHKPDSNVLFIPSDMELYDFLTIEELLHLMKKYSDGDVDENRLLELLELTDKKKCFIDELSMGMKKKLTLLPLFIKPYDLIILDEPFNSIDLNYIYKLKQILREMKTESTIILSSHILETLVDLCDSFVLISNGEIKKTFKNDGSIQRVEGEIFDQGT